MEVARLRAAQTGVKTSPLVARVVIAVPPATHAIVGVATDRGIFLVEPQPDAGPFRIKPLIGYPNQIIEVRL